MNLISKSVAATAAAALSALVSGGVAQAGEDSWHTVYTQTNATSGNAVLAYRVDSHGHAAALKSFATGGTGTGTGLGSQGSVTVSGRYLFAVNAGSDSVSVFRINGSGRLHALGAVPSGGDQPISVTVHDDLAYVLNAGTDANVSGFRLTHRGLRPVAGSTRALSAGAQGPAQVGFAPDGHTLVVTEKASNTIDTFAVDHYGRAASAVTSPSVGATPFGFAFDAAGTLIVSDAGGASSGSAATAYRIDASGHATAVNGAVENGVGTACWVVVDGSRVFTTNGGGGSVSSYSVAGDGALTLTAGVAATAGGAAIDGTLVGDDLAVLDAAGSGIHTFGIGEDGSLSAELVIPVPAGSAGLAAA